VGRFIRCDKSGAQGNIAGHADLHAISLGSIVLFLILAVRKEPLIPPADTLPVLALLGFVGIFVQKRAQY